MAWVDPFRTAGRQVAMMIRSVDQRGESEVCRPTVVRTLEKLKIYYEALGSNKRTSFSLSESSALDCESEPL